MVIKTFNEHFKYLYDPFLNYRQKKNQSCQSKTAFA